MLAACVLTCARAWVCAREFGSSSNDVNGGIPHNHTMNTLLVVAICACSSSEKVSGIESPLPLP